MITSILNVTAISLSMYKIKEFVEISSSIFFMKTNFDNIHSFNAHFVVVVETKCKQKYNYSISKLVDF